MVLVFNKGHAPIEVSWDSLLDFNIVLHVACMAYFSGLACKRGWCCPPTQLKGVNPALSFGTALGKALGQFA